MRAVAPGAIAALGLPAYLLLDHLRLLPPTLRDRPWPVEAVTLGACLWAAGRVVTRKGSERALGAGALAVSLLSAIGLVATARSLRFRLPATPPELAAGRSLPPLSLPDERGGDVELAALRGQPALLLVYRGAF